MEEPSAVMPRQTQHGKEDAAENFAALTVLTTLPSEATVEEMTAVGVTTPNQGCARAAAADSRCRGS